MELGEVFNNLPNLNTFHIDNIECVTKEVFVNIYNKLMTYKGLERFIFDLSSFDLDESKELILEILK